LEEEGKVVSGGKSNDGPEIGGEMKKVSGQKKTMSPVNPSAKKGDERSGRRERKNKKGGGGFSFE